MNKKVHRLPLESIIQTTQQGTTRFTNGYQYIVLSEVETFSDYSVECGFTALCTQPLRGKIREIFKDCVMWVE